MTEFPLCTLILPQREGTGAAGLWKDSSNRDTCPCPCHCLRDMYVCSGDFPEDVASTH